MNLRVIDIVSLGCGHVKVTLGLNVGTKKRTVSRVFHREEILEALDVGLDDQEKAWAILLHLMRNTVARTPGSLAQKVSAIKAEVYRL